MEENTPFEPTLFTALWRYRGLAVLIVGAATALGAFFALSRPGQFEAVATLVVEDPRATALFDAGEVGRPERYVNNQAAILLSRLVAERAAGIALDNAFPFTPDQIARNLDVNVVADSDELEVVFTAAEADRAVTGANSIAAAYEEVRLESVSGTFDRAIGQLDASVEDLNQRLGVVATDIEAALLSEASRGVLNEQYAAALARLSELQALAAATEPGDTLDSIRAQLDDVLQQLETLEAVISIEQTSPELAALLEEQEQLIGRRSELRTRRDGLAVDSSLESTGIVLFSPAAEAESVGLSLLPTLVAAAILGGLIAAVVAYALAVRNRRFGDRGQPEIVIGVPLLAGVPDFREEGVSELPVLNEPASESAESFRFVVSALHRESGWGGEAQRPKAHEAEAVKSFVFVSATVGDGKSVVAANLTLATAFQGKRVLAVDADFGDQRLTNLLLRTKPAKLWRRDPVAPVSLGLSDLIDKHLAFEQIAQTVKVDGFPAFDLVSRGRAAVSAPQFFGMGIVKEYFTHIRDRYDVVLIDAPPLLQVAYSSSLIEDSDRAIIVVPHRSHVSRMEEVTDRLELLQARVLGYVYTRAPVRADLPTNEGSLVDILGMGRFK